MKIKYSIIILLSCVALSALLYACKKPKATAASEPVAPAQTATAEPATETQAPSARKMSNFEYLKQCLSGNFNNSAEREASSISPSAADFRFVPVLPSSENVFYVYFDFTHSSVSTAPTTARVIKIFRESDSHFIGYMYKIPDPSFYTSAKAGAPIFQTLDQEEIIEEIGCQVNFYFSDETQSFNASMNKQDCGTDIQGTILSYNLLNISEGKITATTIGVANGSDPPKSTSQNFLRE